MHILPTKQAVMMACLCHYHLDTSLMMHYLGNNYTCTYCIVHDTICTLRHYHTQDPLINKYTLVMTIGCLAKFVATSTHTNALLHWHLLNYLFIQAKLQTVAGHGNNEQGG
jgi:hypothetical protein